MNVLDTWQRTRIKKESEPVNGQLVSPEPEEMESESFSSPEPTRTSEEPTCEGHSPESGKEQLNSLPTLQDTYKVILDLEDFQSVSPVGEDLSNESSPPPPGFQDFSNVSLITENVQTKDKQIGKQAGH